MRGLVVVGGYLGDNVLGTKRTIVLGLIILSLGYFSLALTDKQHVFLALGLICVGNGLFKANPSNLLAKCYQPQDTRLHSGFTLYYMAINLGSMVALIVGPNIAAHYGYSPAYLLSALGLVLALLNYWVQRKHLIPIHSKADARRINGLAWVLIVAALVVVTEVCAYLLQHVVLTKKLLWLTSILVTGAYFYLMTRENKSSFMNMLVAFILMIQAVVFFTLYQQMPTSLTLFAVNNVCPDLFGIRLDSQSFQALNPIWIVTMSPVLASIYGFLHRKNILFFVPQKFALGMTLCGLGFLVLYFSRYVHTDQGLVSSWWLIISYLFQSLGELLISALGVAMVAELVPPSIAGFVMGMWFLTSAIAGFLGALVASFTALPEHIKPGVESLMIYTDVFACIGIVTLAIAGLMWVLSPVLSRAINSIAEEQPATGVVMFPT